MRGKGSRCAISFPFPRITPAYAGKSSAMSRIKSLCWDHPRLCGEKCNCTIYADFLSGSPPPMRGKVVMSGGHIGKTRITPAYAGKRTNACLPCRGILDHPRLCGEKQVLPCRRHSHEGSPPPMRGKVLRHTHTQNGFRITPAYAGKSAVCERFGFGCWDHPRLCGEKGRRSRGRTVDVGSPPPMRGKAQRPYKPHRACGITPAYAGKSLQSETGFQIRQDHPRLCGEKLTHAALPLNRLGSPPPMRGKVIDTKRKMWCIRITPAYAGKSQRRNYMLLG